MSNEGYYPSPIQKPYLERLKEKGVRERTEAFNRYSEDAAATAIYPGHGDEEMRGVNYCVLGLVGEAGELANKLKKVHRDDQGYLYKETSDALIDELGDVLWYVDRLAAELGSSLAEVALRNIEKLHDRKDRGEIGGSGDNR